MHNVERRVKIDQLVAPDGGWGWIVLAAAFFTGCLIGSMGMLFSLILDDLLVTMNTTATTVSWIPSTLLFLAMLCVPLASAVSLRFSNRTTAIIGGLIYFISLFSSSFVTQIGTLILTFGVLGGLGSAFSFASMLFAINDYFDKRRGRVTGIYMSGMSFGRFSFALILQVILNNYGFRGTMLIMSAIMLNICMFGCLLQPVKWHLKPAKDLQYIESNSLANPSEKSLEELTTSKEIPTLETDPLKQKDNVKYSNAVSKYGSVKLENTDLQQVKLSDNNQTCWKKFCTLMGLDFSVLQHPSVFIVCASNVINICVSPYVSTFLPALFLTKGFEPLNVAMLMSIMALCEICGRICTPWIDDYKLLTVRTVLMISSFIYATLIWALTLYEDYYINMVICGFGGLLSGGLTSTNTIAMTNVLGPQNLPSVMAFTKVIQGFFTLAMGPLLGLARDYTGRFETSYLFLSLIQYCSVFVWLIEPSIKNKFLKAGSPT